MQFYRKLENQSGTTKMNNNPNDNSELSNGDILARHTEPGEQV